MSESVRPSCPGSATDSGFILFLLFEGDAEHGFFADFITAFFFCEPPSALPALFIGAAAGGGELAGPSVTIATGGGDGSFGLW